MSHFSANEDHRELYEMGKEEGRASLRRYQFDMAKKNPTMSIWLGKQYLGQQDKQAHEHSGGIVNEIALKIVDPKR